MKKRTVAGAALAVAFVVSSMSVAAFAASNPADDTDSYSFNSGRQSYESRMAESHTWYDQEEKSAAADYRFHAGSQTAQSRDSAFAGMPSGDDLAKEDIEAWFEANGIGEGAAWSNGTYDESARSSYGYSRGQAVYQ